MAGPFPTQVSEPLRTWRFRLLGTGASNPTKLLCRNANVVWVSTGLYRVTFPEKPGAFAGLGGFSLQAATQANVAGCTLVAGDYNASTKTIDVSLFSGGTTPALRNLAANEWLNFTLDFLHG